MGSKSKKSRQRKQSTKFAIKGPATTVKKARNVDSKSTPQSTNIDISITTKSRLVLKGGYRRRLGKVPAPVPSSTERISKGSKTERKHVSSHNDEDRHHRKKGKQEWNSNYENLAERGYAATVLSHSIAGKRRSSSRKHATASSQDASSAFQFQAASFSAVKTTSEILQDTTSTLSTIHLIPTAESHQFLETCQNTIARKADDNSQEHAINCPPTKNRFQLLNDETEDDSPGDSKQPSFSFAFQPPSFSLMSESSLPTALLSQLHMENTADDVDPDL